MRYPWLFALLLLGCHSREASTPLPTTHTTSAIVTPVVDAPEAPESTVPPRDGERVITQLRPRFRDCYERGLLEENHVMSGVVVLHMRVAPDGTVRAVDIAKRSGLSGAVATCLSHQAQRAIFEAPGPGGAALDVPVHFVRSNLAAR